MYEIAKKKKRNKIIVKHFRKLISTEMYILPMAINVHIHISIALREMVLFNAMCARECVCVCVRPLGKLRRKMKIQIKT